jgi:hypothetical protein
MSARGLRAITSWRKLGWKRHAHNLHRDRAPPCHICAETVLSLPTSAPGPHSPLPRLHRDWAHPCPYLRRDATKLALCRLRRMRSSSSKRTRRPSASATRRRRRHAWRQRRPSTRRPWAERAKRRRPSLKGNCSTPRRTRTRWSAPSSRSWCRSRPWPASLMAARMGAPSRLRRRRRAHTQCGRITPRGCRRRKMSRTRQSGRCHSAASPQCCAALWARVSRSLLSGCVSHAVWVPVVVAACRASCPACRRR